MKVLLDTHLLLWALAASRRLPEPVRDILTDSGNEILFSAASIWEVAIKSALGRRDFRIDLPKLLKGAHDTGFVELPVAADHAAGVRGLPPLHRDPFDRLLIAQARVESALFITNDAQLAGYGPQVRVL